MLNIRGRRSLCFAATSAALSLTVAGCGSTDDEGPSDAGGDVVFPVADANVPEEAAATVDADVDAGFSMKTWKPSAKGLWIWYFDYLGMTAAEAATKAQSLGVGYVLIKSGQDGNFWGDPRFGAASLNEFTSRGMRVLAWPYITPAGGAAAIAAAVKAATVPGCDGLVLDVEIEWETGPDHSAQVKTLCEGIRAGAPGVWLGYTSFGWVGYHTGFPFKAFDTYCGDSAWPQVYFSDRGVSWNGQYGISEARSMYEAAGLKAPLWLIASNDDIAGTSAGPTTVDLNGFLDDAGTYSSLWEFPQKATPATKLNQLTGLHWKN